MRPQLRKLGKAFYTLQGQVALRWLYAVPFGLGHIHDLGRAQFRAAIPNILKGFGSPFKILNQHPGQW